MGAMESGILVIALVVVLVLIVLASNLIGTFIP